MQAKGAIRDQLERSSLSIPLNLAEGSAQTSKAQRKKFYLIAYASFKEAQCILQILEAKKEMQSEASILGAHLYKLVHAL